MLLIDNKNVTDEILKIENYNLFKYLIMFPWLDIIRIYIVKEILRKKNRKTRTKNMLKITLIIYHAPVLDKHGELLIQRT